MRLKPSYFGPVKPRRASQAHCKGLASPPSNRAKFAGFDGGRLVVAYLASCTK